MAGIADYLDTETEGGSSRGMSTTSGHSYRLAGLAYWYALYPFHEWIFGGMPRSIAKTVGKPVVRRPERFTPRLKHACRIDRQQK